MDIFQHILNNSLICGITSSCAALFSYSREWFKHSGKMFILYPEHFKKLSFSLGCNSFNVTNSFSSLISVFCRFGRSLRVYNIEFLNEVIYDGYRSEKGDFFGPVDLVLTQSLDKGLELVSLTNRNYKIKSTKSMC